LDIVELGEFLKARRKELGYTLSKLAELSGVSHPYLSQIENGKLQNIPSSEILIKLSGPLDIPSVQLLDFAGHIEDFYIVDNEFSHSIDEIQADRLEFLEQTLCILSDDNGFYQNLNSYLETLIKKYRLNLKEGENITPEFFRNLIKSADANVLWIERLIKDLVRIAKKNNLDYKNVMSKFMREEFEQTELDYILLKKNISYKGTMLTEKHRRLIVSYLDVLFSIDEEGD
jgi:transcriptional regulator with XRE-family HTH domain